jgi:phage I-like protein
VLERITLSASLYGGGVIRNADGIPTDIRLLDRGVNRSTKGDLLYSDQSASLIKTESQDWGNEYFFDYDHATFDEKNTAPDKGISAGWYKLEDRADGLWAVGISWTPRALEYLKNKEYKYFSPTFFYNKSSKEFVGYVNTALTNYPARKNLEPLVLNNHEQPEDARFEGRSADRHSISLDQLCSSLERLLETLFPNCWISEVFNDYAVFRFNSRTWSVPYVIESDQPRLTGDAVEVVRTYVPVSGGTTMKVLLNALGLKDDASEAQAVERFNAFQAQNRELLALTGKDSLPEALGVIQGWKQGAAATATAQARIAELEGAVKTGELNALIEEGKKNGKLTPALEAWARTQEAPALKAFLEVAPVAVQKTEHKEPGGSSSSSAEGVLMHKGKTWDQLDGTEKHNLYHDDNALYRAMRDASGN